MEHIAVIDFGSQYTQLIIRKIRELGVFSRIYLPDKFAFTDEMKGIILSGGPMSVLDKNSPKIPLQKLGNKRPILGICYGMQLLGQLNKARITRSLSREYGRMDINIIKNSKLFSGIPRKFKVWMSHGDCVSISRQNGLVKTSISSSNIASSFEDKNHRFYAIQFHPEVKHTDFGNQILSNFLFEICNLNRKWNNKYFIDKAVKTIKDEVGNNNCLCAISGGVDSTTAAALAHKALGKKLKCVFVNNGLLRKNEFNETMKMLKKLGLTVYGIDATSLFLKRLKGITSPERKRKIIGKTFIDIFTKVVKQRFPRCKCLIQGTLYPDVIESISASGSKSVTIKTHHNVGGLPKKLHFKLIEPFRLLFKDEVRKIARRLKLAEEFITKQPFPGPGLGVRIMGEVTADKIKILQEADAIARDIVEKNPIKKQLWQYFVVLLPTKTVGVQGDQRQYNYVAALRAVTSEDAMTADWAKLPHELLEEISSNITNKIDKIGRVVYDISSKPPATIEWE